VTDTVNDLETLSSALERVLDADPPRPAEAAEIMEKLLAHPDAADISDMAGLLEELASCYAELGRLDEAIRTIRRSIALSDDDGVPRKLRLAEFYLRAGRDTEARDTYATVKSAAPEDAWIYHAAASDYLGAGDQVRALQWINEGIEVARRTGDPDHLMKRLTARKEQIQAHGAPVVPPQSVAGLGYFPPDQFVRAVELWPQLKQEIAATYDDYRRLVQQTLVKLKAQGQAAWVVPIQIERFRQWSQLHKHDPATAAARSEYAAYQLGRGAGVAWPPDRNDPCWCGSGQKYKKCCGAL
jgi:tetratricopeptide (TPR) repeat protein